MELVGILRPLSRRPILVVIGMLAAIAAGVFVAGGGTKTTGTASARVMVDTTKSQLLYQAPTGADTLPWRAVLLAYLGGSRPLTDHIANEVGIRRNELVLVYPTLEAPETPATLPTRAAEAAGLISEKYVLTVDFEDLLPIISLKAKAPSRRAARRLVEAAVRTLENAGTPAQVTPQTQDLAVKPTGPVRSKSIVHKPQPLLGAAVAIVLFGIWSAAVAFVPLLLNAWRHAGPRPRLV
jgi:hypothetical protein